MYTNIIQFGPKEIGSVALAIVGDGLAEEKKKGPIFTPVTNIFMQFLLVNITWAGVSWHTAILFGNIAIIKKTNLVVIFLPNPEFSSNFQLLRNPVAKHITLSMIINFEVLGKFNLVYGCRPETWCKIRQVGVCERPSSCALWIDFLKSCMFPQTTAIFLADRLFLWRIGVKLLFTEQLLSKRWIIDFERPLFLL